MFDDKKTEKQKKKTYSTLTICAKAFWKTSTAVVHTRGLRNSRYDGPLGQFE